MFMGAVILAPEIVAAGIEQFPLVAVIDIGIFAAFLYFWINVLQQSQEYPRNTRIWFRFRRYLIFFIAVVLLYFLLPRLGISVSEY